MRNRLCRECTCGDGDLLGIVGPVLGPRAEKLTGVVLLGTGLDAGHRVRYEEEIRLATDTAVRTGVSTRAALGVARQAGLLFVDGIGAVRTDAHAATRTIEMFHTDLPLSPRNSQFPVVERLFEMPTGRAVRIRVAARCVRLAFDVALEHKDNGIESLQDDEQQ